MTFDKEKELIYDVFSKDRWESSIERFIQVLRINIFLVDASGNPILGVCSTKWSEACGCRILSSLLEGSGENGQIILKKFLPYREYYEYRSEIGFHVFAVPLKIHGRVMAYMMVGPVIMNRRLPDDQYLEIASAEGIAIDGLLDQMREMRAVSYLAMNAILDLLASIAAEFISIGLENRRLKKWHLQRSDLSQSVDKVAKGLYKEIHEDDLLISVLDVALKLTGAESGSIMVFDKDNKQMMIRVARGLSDKYISSSYTRMGEGIAGIAAEENRCFFIKGQEGEDRLKPFLTRPDIKESMVMPIARHNRVFGVLNIHSKKPNAHIEANSGHLVSLAKLLSTAVSS